MTPWSSPWAIPFGWIQEEASLSPGTALVLLVLATLLVAPLSEALTGRGRMGDWLNTWAVIKTQLFWVYIQDYKSIIMVIYICIIGIGDYTTQLCGELYFKILEKKDPHIRSSPVVMECHSESHPMSCRFRGRCNEDVEYFGCLRGGGVAPYRSALGCCLCVEKRVENLDGWQLACRESCSGSGTCDSPPDHHHWHDKAVLHPK